MRNLNVTDLATHKFQDVNLVNVFNTNIEENALSQG
jgi:hypothetical protein